MVGMVLRERALGIGIDEGAGKLPSGALGRRGTGRTGFGGHHADIPGVVTGDLVIHPVEVAKGRSADR